MALPIPMTEVIWCP